MTSVLSDLRRALLKNLNKRLVAAVVALAVSTGAICQQELKAQSVTPPPVVAGEAFSAGDIAVTGFAGVKLQSESLPPGVDPVSKTVLDPDGVTLRIFDAATFGAPQTGQVLSPQTKLELKARDIGHVFALAFDGGSPDGTTSPSLYAAATSAFGLNIVGPDQDGDGKPDRLGKGGPGAAFMDGQFGSGKGAGPGTIWKVDRATGAASIFANIETNGSANSGAGIGGLAIDFASKTLYASDLDTGLIHLFSLQKAGADRGVFDHGLVGRPSRGKAVVKDDRSRLDITSPDFDPAKPDTWKYTAPARRIHGLSVHDGRLYYAVAEGSEIWSVGLEADGAFKIDARFEAGIGGDPEFPFTGIVFDRDGHMILAQRGRVKNPADYSQFVDSGDSKVLRLTPQAGDDAARWKLNIEEYAVSNAEGHRASSGGLATHYGYKPDGSIDLATCDGTLVVSADALGGKRVVHGLQLTDIDLVRPANVPPSQSVSINWDARQDDVQARGYAGGVASFQNCQGGAGFPAVADGGAEPPPVAGAEGFPPVDDGGEATAPPVEPTPPPVEDATIPVDPNAPVDPQAPVDPNATVQTGPIIVTKTATSTCTAKGPCAFTITVTNNGDTNLSDFVIDEQINAPQAVLVGEANAPWTCTKAAPFLCTHNGSLAAKATVELQLSFTPNTTPDKTELTNCAIPRQPAPAAPAKQLVPEKKSEAPLPFGGNTLVQNASFTVPAPGKFQSLIQRAGGIGGNIGGVSCLKRKPAEAATFIQDDGALITLVGIKVDGAGQVTGRAGILGSKTGSISEGTFDGEQFRIVITWSDGTKSSYRGGFDDQGNLSGGTRNFSNGRTRNFKAQQAWKCAENSACRDYANKALSQVSEFKALDCGPLPLQMSEKRDDHVNFCMGTHDTPIDGEHVTRDQQIAACKARKIPKFEPITKLKVKPAPAEPLPVTDPPAPEQCAVVAIDPQTEPAPIKGPNLKLSKRADACVLNNAKARFECNFVITIANTGDTPFKGPITVRDVMLDADSVTMDVTTVAPWSCEQQGDPGIGLRSCTARDVSLDPQASTTLPLTVTVPSNLTSLCVVTNNAEILDPPGGGPLNTIKDDDVALRVSALVPNKSCKPVNLSVTKTATPDCVKNAAGNFVCTYAIAVNNNSANPFEGTFKLTDQFPPFLSVQGVPKDCNITATGFSCSGQAQGALVAGTPFEILAQFEVSAANATPDKCKLKNKIRIEAPAAGTINNIDGNDDVAEATAKIPMVPGPDGEVPCDPPSLELTKVANPPVCAKAAGGFRCSYDIAVKSNGPDPFHGALLLQDTLPAGATLDTASGNGWTCKGDRVVECSHAFVDVAVGDSLGVKVSVLMPDGNVKPGACQVTNSVALSMTAGPLKGKTFNASATAAIQSPLCTAPAAPPVQTECTNGMVPTSAGACACPPETSFNGRACSGGGSNTLQPPAVVPTPPPVGCLGGMELTAGGSCACPDGKRFSGRTCIDDPGSGGSYPSKSDVDDDEPAPRPKKPPQDDVADPTCPASRPSGEYPNCCPRGLRFSQGTCRAPRPVDPPPVKIKDRCSGSRPVGDYPDCCPVGTSFKRGACRPNRPTEPPPTPRCSGNRPVGEYPYCCPIGTRYQAGACRRPEVPNQPQPGPGPIGKICPDGTKVFGKYTQCPYVKPKQPEPRPPRGPCPPGMIGRQPNCRPTPPVACPPGTRKVQRGTRVVCQPIPRPAPTPTTPQCNPGSVYNNATKSCDRLNPK